MYMLEEKYKKILKIQDITLACKEIKKIRNTYKNTQSLPIWFRELVFQVIYNYLARMYEEIEKARLNGANFKKTKAIRQCYKTQTQLLEDMGLVKDIFRKTHWNMYSPDRKAEQSVYISINLPLMYKEVECNEIYRAMIHYMVCHTKVPTDTFVDMYAEFGLPSLFCANGYKNELWVENEKLFQIWKDTLQSKRNCKMIYKRIKEIQELLKGNEHSIQQKQISEFLQKYWLSNLLEIGKPEEEIDKIRLVIGTFIANSFVPEYWVDRNLIIERNVVTEWLDETKISKERIQTFIAMTKREFFYFAEQYQKVTIRKMDKENAIWLLTNKHIYYKALKDKKEREFLKNYNKLLYIDAPKYIREYARKNFDSFQHMNLVKMLKNYDGEWILTWKNNIEKERIFYGIHKQRWELEKEAKARIGEISLEEKEPDVYDILGELKKIDTNPNRPIYVFKYKKEEKNHLGDLVFITNIQFPRIKSKDFFSRYFLQKEATGRFVREKYSNFYRYAISSNLQ